MTVLRRTWAALQSPSSLGCHVRGDLLELMVLQDRVNGKVQEEPEIAKHFYPTVPINFICRYMNISMEDTSGEAMSTVELENVVSDFSRFYILMILYEGPTHGYNIISKFRKRIGKEISPSLVYPFLEQLTRKGFVRYTLKPVGAKTRKVFELTEEGKELCRRLFKRFSALVTVAIEESLSICANCGCKVYEGGYQKTINGKTLTFCCVHCAASYERST